MTERTFDYFRLWHPLSRLRSRFALRARRRMFDLFMSHAGVSASSSVLDLGVTPDATLPESNHFEQVFPYPEKLTAASVEPVSGLQVRFPKVRFVRIEPGPLPFADRQFDACFCSAVIEHVGSRDQQQQFLKEIARVSRRFCVTTPNRWFPLDFHTLVPLAHWLPQSVHQQILRALGKNFWAQTENLNLLSERNLLDMTPAGVKARVVRLRLGGWTSNLVYLGESSDADGAPGRGSAVDQA